MAPKGNKPRQIADGACIILCPTSGRTLFTGFHPLFGLDCRRRSGALIQTLAPHQAKPGLQSGGASSIQEPPCSQASPPGFKLGFRAASLTPAYPVSTGSTQS